MMMIRYCTYQNVKQAGDVDEAKFKPRSHIGKIPCSRLARGPHRRAALAMRYASARAARDFGKSAAENSDETGRKQQLVCRLVVK
jgi:hypothetical protein